MVPPAGGVAGWQPHFDLANSDLEWQYKGWPRSTDSTDLQSIASQRLNIFSDDFMFPVAVISARDLDHNLATVARFCERNDVSLAPHGKTTMSPEIVERQLETGAWAITAATASQARIFRAFGATRILIAHQVIDPAAVRWVRDELDNDPDVHILCLVDSVAGVELMERALDGTSEGRAIDVLVELGLSGGRTGCRTIENALEVAERVASSPILRLIGTEGYEGIIHFDGSDLSDVDAFLRRLRDLTEQLDDAGMFDHLDEIVITAGGSMLPDRVVAILGSDWSSPRPVRLIIRPGCYVTHDSIHYEDSGPFGVRAPMDGYPRLRAALTVWSYVVSRPEPELALLGFGKRDVSYDIDLPRPVMLKRGEQMQQLDGELEVFGLDDQHAYVRVPLGFELSVGELIGCGISHPCTTFERWRAIPLVDDNFDVVGSVRTFF